MARRLSPLESVGLDIRAAFVALRREQWFALTPTAILAVAIGLNATVFTVMEAMLFRGFPHVQENHRLLYLQERNPANMLMNSYADVQDWKRQATAFADLAFVGGRQIEFRDSSGGTADLRVTTVSANAFEVLKVQPLLGRDFEAADERDGAPPVALLNYRFWDRHFNRQPDIVGMTILIGASATTIIGVMPQGFDFPTQTPMWLPEVRTLRHSQRGATPGGFMTVGRLRDGATRDDATMQLESINRRLQLEFPSTNGTVSVSVADHSEIMSGRQARTIWGSLWIGSWLVLLIACANVANLTLLRTVARRHEYQTRFALGAGTARIVRQIAVECALVAAAAGSIAWALTNWSIREWASITESQYQILDYRIDWTTGAYLVAMSMATAVMLAAAPVARVLHLSATGALQVQARGVTLNARGKRLAATLIAMQMALAIILLTGSGVLLRSLLNIVGAETGVINAEQIQIGLARLPSAHYRDAEARAAYFARLENQLRSSAAVASVALASTTPVRGTSSRAIAVEGRPDLSDKERFVGVLVAGAGYFDVVGRQPISGRVFASSDGASGRKVAVVNTSFADTFWPNESAVGKRLEVTNAGTASEWRIVVGVVPNIMQNDSLRQTFRPLVYVPFAQEPPPLTAFFLARLRVPPQQAAQTIRAIVQDVDPRAGLERFSTLQASFAFERDFMDAEHSELGKHATVGPVFAVIALVIGCIGLVAVLGHSVTQRTKEIGVRMAVGAAARDISRMIVREALGPVLAGVGLGLAAALAINRLIQSQLVGVSPYDPVTLVGAPLLLLAVALLACRLPARRAMGVDPVVALRHE